jgi:hypothetical protein
MGMVSLLVAPHCSSSNDNWKPLIYYCQWLWITVCYAGPLVVNRGVLCWASGCDSWCAMLCKWLWIICVMQIKINYNYTLFINGGLNEWGSDCCLTPTQQLCSYIIARTS